MTFQVSWLNGHQKWTGEGLSLTRRSFHFLLCPVNTETQTEGEGSASTWPTALDGRKPWLGRGSKPRLHTRPFNPLGGPSCKIAVPGGRSHKTILA